MERQDGCLAGRVVCHSRYTNETCGTGDSDNVSFVRANHVWQEGFDCVPVAEDIDIKDLSQILIRSRQDSVRGENTGIINENCRSTKGGFDF